MTTPLIEIITSPAPVIEIISPDMRALETTVGAQAKANAARDAAVATVLGAAGAAYDTLGEIQTILTNDESAAAALTTLVSTKAPINNPTFTGTVNAPAVILSTGVVTPYVGEVAGTGSYLTFNAAAAVRVETRAATNVGMIVKGSASQSVNIQEWQDSAGVVRTAVDQNGRLYSITAANFGAFPAGLTFLGVSSNGNAGTVVSMIRGAAAQSASLTEWQNSAGSVFAKVDSNGVVTSNGFISAGTGNALGGGNFGGTTLSLSTAATGTIGAIIRGVAGQTADFLQLQNNSGTVLASVNNAGVFGGRAASLTAAGTTDTSLFVQGIASQSTTLTAFKAGASATGDLMQFLNSGGTARLRVNFDGSIVGSNAASHSLGSSTQIANNTLAVYATGTSGVPLIVKTVASQSADMQQWQDSAGLNRATVNNDGSFYSNPSSATTVAYIAKAAVSQSASIQEWRDSSGAQLTRVGSDGAFGRGSSYLLSPNTSLANLLVASATSSVVLATRAVSGQTADYQQWQDGSGLTRVRISAGGQMGIEPTALATATPSDASSAQLAFGTAYWNGTASTNEYGYIQASRQGGTPTTAGQFRIAFSHNTNPDNAGLALMMDGSKTATIGFGFGSPSDGQLFVNTTLATRVGFKVRGAPSQSADIQQWADSGNGVLARVTFDGTIKAPFFSASSRFTSDAGIFGGAATESLSSSSSFGFRSYSTTLATVIIKATASQTADILQVQDSAGALLVKIGSAGFLAADMGLRARPDSAPSVGLTVKGQASQSGDLTQWTDSANTVLSRVTNTGNLYVGNGGAGPNTLGIADGTIIKQSGSGFVFNTGITSLAYLGVGAAGGGSTKFLVAAGVATDVPAVIRGFTSQTANLQEWQDSAGTPLANVSATGRAVFTNVTAGQSGVTSRFGDATATTISGCAVGISPNSGASTIPLIIKSAASQTADLTQWQDSTGVAVAQMRASGKIAHKNTVINLSGSFSDPGDRFALQIAGSYPGTFSNTTSYGIQIAPTIVSPQASHMSVWSRPVADGAILVGTGTGYYAEAPLTTNSAAFTTTYGFTNTGGYTYAAWLRGQTVLEGFAAAVPVAIIKGIASQTGNLTEWQDSSGTVLTRMSSAGNLWIGNGGAGPFTLGIADGSITKQSGTGFVMNSGLTALSLQVNNNTAGTPVAVFKGAASQTADLTQWQDSTGAVRAAINSSGVILAAFGLSVAGASYTGAAAAINSGSTTNVALILRGITSQTGDIQQWQNASGVMTKVKANGEYESAVAGNAASDAGGGTGGIVLKSPDGTRYRVTVANGGTLTVTAA